MDEFIQCFNDAALFSMILKATEPMPSGGGQTMLFTIRIRCGFRRRQRLVVQRYEHGRRERSAGRRML